MAKKKKGDTSNEVFSTTNISDSLKSDYLMYALAVMPRSIPLATDGLTAIQRRILFVLKDFAGRKVKSARIIGDVLGKYSPHGDTAAYGALVSMTQHFKRNLPLNDPQGNWGSHDGDSPAAMRYTESQISKWGSLLFFGPEYKHCDYKDNYDSTIKEPESLSPKIPVVLINGNQGIGVGFASDIPPHNPREVCNAVLAYLDGKDPCNEIKGPDFPTGGNCVSLSNSVKRGISSGTGSYVIVPSYDIEHHGRGRYAIVVKDIPYTTNKGSFADTMLSKFNGEGKVKIRYKGEFLVNYISNILDESDGKADTTRLLIVFKKIVNEDDVAEIATLLVRSRVISYSGKYSTTMLEYNPSNVVSPIGVGSGSITPVRAGVKDVIRYWYNYRSIVLTRYFKHEINRINDRLTLLKYIETFIQNFKFLSNVILDNSITEIYKQFKMKGIPKDGVDYIMSSSFGRFKNKGADFKNEIIELKRSLKYFNKSLKDINGYIREEVEMVKKEIGSCRRKTKLFNKVKL